MIRIDPSNVAGFNNRMDFCVGTGRMGLALRKEYIDQLRLVQEYIGFDHIRGHGLFTDDMAIYQDQVDFFDKSKKYLEYNFTYLDLVMDNYLDLGIRPFIELGFMPGKLASGDQTVFYWKGNVTPPKSYDKWCDLVKATLRHLIDRYGRDEVVTWPVEVWNEPNLTVFWKDADMQEYFKLFDRTFEAVKEVDPEFKVGGPAVCGGSDELWISSFMDHVEEKGLDIDFVTRHHYTTEPPRFEGHYGYPPLSEAEDGFKDLHTTRDIIDSHERYRGLPIHITEYNTSYIPNAPVHDTTRNAAYIAQQLSRLGDDNESYSYWTFGDVFEEHGVPFTPFHGGFGLVADGCIPKPTFWTFVFYKQIKGMTCVHKDDDCIVMKDDKGGYHGICWNYTRWGEGKEKTTSFSIPVDNGRYCIVRNTVDENNANPLKIWHDLGEPSSLSKEEKRIILAGAKPGITTESVTVTEKEMELKIVNGPESVVKFDIYPAALTADRGYDYDRVIRGEEPDPEETAKN